MTVFDVRKHDFLARIGNLRISEDTVISTPAVCETEELFPSLKKRAFSNMPLSAPASDAEKYVVAGEEPSAVHPKTDASADASVYLFANWNNTLEDSKRFLETYEDVFFRVGRRGG